MIVEASHNPLAVGSSPTHPTALLTTGSSRFARLSADVGPAADRWGGPPHDARPAPQGAARDVLEYRERTRRERRRTRDEMAAAGEEAGLYEATATPRRTRWVAIAVGVRAFIFCTNETTSPID